MSLNCKKSQLWVQKFVPLSSQSFNDQSRCVRNIFGTPLMVLIQCPVNKHLNNILAKQCLRGNSKYEFVSMRDLVRDLSAIEPVYQHYCRAKNCRQLESFYQRFKTQVISKAISRKFLVHCKIITVVKFTSVSNQCSLGLEAISSSSMPQNYWTILGWF